MLRSGWLDCVEVCYVISNRRSGWKEPIRSTALFGQEMELGLDRIPRGRRIEPANKLQTTKTRRDLHGVLLVLDCLDDTLVGAAARREATITQNAAKFDRDSFPPRQISSHHRYHHSSLEQEASPRRPLVR